MKKDYAVIHGFRPSAGQPTLLAQELRRIGIRAESAIVGPNSFAYPADIQLSDPSQMSNLLGELGSRFDVFHIHAITPFFKRGNIEFPMGTDLLALKAAGIRIVMHFRGSEVRMPSVFAEKSPFNYVDENPKGIYTHLHEQFQRQYIDLCCSLADAVIVGDPELQTYIPDAIIVPRAINLEQFQKVPSNNLRPLIVHAPSSQTIKGTQFVIDAIDQLRSEGLEFDFELVENVPHSEATSLYARSDIIVDQLRIGWYGVLAVEGMALGKAVVTYIRSDLECMFPQGSPVANANPHTLVDILRKLISDQVYRHTVAERGHQYCQEIHDGKAVALVTAKIYEELLETRPKFDLKNYLSINKRQSEDMVLRMKKAQNTINRLKSAQNTGGALRRMISHGRKVLNI